MNSATGKASRRLILQGTGFIAVAILALTTIGRDPMLALEARYFDYFQSLRSPAPSERITLIEVPPGPAADGDPRYLADLVTAVAALDPDQIVSVVPVHEPDSELDLDQLEALLRLQRRAPAAQPSLVRQLTDMRQRLAAQSALLDAMRGAGNVFIALPDGTTAAAAMPTCLANRVVAGDDLRPTVLAALPGALFAPVSDELCRAVAGAGHVLYTGDADGRVRRTQLLVAAGDQLVPGLALSAAAAALGPRGARPAIERPGVLRVGQQRWDTGGEFALFDHYYAAPDGTTPFTVLKDQVLLQGSPPTASLSGKIVVIGPLNADGPGALLTPDGRRLTPAMLVANSLSNLLQRDFVVRPAYAHGLELVLLLACGAVPLLLLHWVGQPTGRAAAALLAAAAVIGAHAYLIVAHGLWLQMVSGALLVLLGAGVLELLRSIAGGTPARTVGPAEPEQDASSTTAEQMLAMKFAVLKHQPNDAKTKADLFHLAVRYARIKQFAEAERVLRHLAVLDPEYRNVQDKLARLSGLSPRRQTAQEPATAAMPADDPPAEASPGDRRRSEQPPPDGRARGGRAIDRVAVDTHSLTIKRLGRYNLLRELGSGAMAHVYLAEDPNMRRHVAIKTLALADEFADEDLQTARDHFAREARSAGRLNHPNIIGVYDFGEENGLSYLVMEYFPGHPATAFTAPDRLLPPEWVLELIGQAADALHYAHKQNVIHRDIKPANLMYDPASDALKIADFGIARLTDTNLTRSGIIMGTPTYMAPEQFLGEEIDGRADLYALGVTLYQLLTGSVPFRAVSIPQLLECVLHQQHKPLSTVRSGLPASLDDVLNQAMAKDREQRFPTGRAMAEALAEVRRTMVAK